jgi:predicted deacetylase
MTITTDDLCLSYLDKFNYFDIIKQRLPNFKMIAFAIGNFNNHELLSASPLFASWYELHKGWVEIGVHSYDHQYPPDGDRDDEKVWIKKATDSLRPFLKENWIYRSPGWQTSNKTVSILRELGFTRIAYENRINNIKTNQTEETVVINSHLYDISSLLKIKEYL